MIGALGPILIPSKAWVDAAHKNGVKVIGTIFFAPAVFGGTPAAVQSFLQKDIAGNFIAADKMMQIANYYNFDGWIMNCETSVNSATGTLVASFMNRLDSAYTGELIWYDAMLPNGSVSYQNRLNVNNAYFFQHSTGLFTNYAWSNTATVTSSQSYALGLGQSPFKVYTGADLWPNRTAQPAFTNYTWIDKIISGGIAKTSIALFATNFTFNYGGFSNFNNDSNDYATFYAAERKIFTGIDQDPFSVDAQWKGIGHYISARSTITSLPFETAFNTGHGFNYYANGSILTAGSWHNMSHQDILPTWMFHSGSINLNYYFVDAYSGGSCLNISAAAAGNYSIPLYSTYFTTNTNLLNLELVLKSGATTIDSISIELKKKDNTLINSVFHPSHNGSWETLMNNGIAAGLTDTIVEIILNIHSTGAFALNIGKFAIQPDSTFSIFEEKNKSSSFHIYPNPSAGIFSVYTNGNSGMLSIFNLMGDKVLNKTINPGETQKLELPDRGVYMYEFISRTENKQGKLVVE